MKRKWFHPKEPDTGRQHWRSQGELDDTPEFRTWLEQEFPQGAAEMEADETSRRQFMKLMGASTALAGFGVACRRPVGYIVPFNEHVEWIVPGNALYYSTCKPRPGGIGCVPLVATTFEGRPTKVDGNRLHPEFSSATSAYTQASILEMYDQDRSNGYLNEGKPVPSTAFEAEFLTAMRERTDGEKVAFLVSPSSSPTRNRLLQTVLDRYPGAKTYSYEALSSDGAEEAYTEMYGQGVVPLVNLKLAEKILLLDSDCFGLESAGEDIHYDFSIKRDPLDGEMNRLYAVENCFTLSGGLADHRYRVATSQVPAVTALFAEQISKKTGDSALAKAAKAALKKVEPSVYNLKWIKECAADLAASIGESVVIAGKRQPAEVHYLVAGINQALDAYGKHISLVQHDLPEYGPIQDLAQSIEDEEVDTLFVLNHGDVAFDAPSELGFGKLLEKVPTTVQLGYRVNDTTGFCDWHVPGTHYLESWSDHYSLSGYYSVQQPMIAPIWGGISENVFLLSLLMPEMGEGGALAEVKKSYGLAGGADWEMTLRDGYSKSARLSEIPYEKSVAQFVDRIGKMAPVDMPWEEAVEVTLAVGGATFDGRFANNGWLQEAPNPITKLTWDNAALMSAATADYYELEDGDMIELTAGERSLKVPALRCPGHADFSITLDLGYYGKTGHGIVSKGAGFNAYPLMTSAERYVVTGVGLRKTGWDYPLALTAEHYSMEGRAIAREGTLEAYNENPKFAKYQGMDSHIPENMPLYQGPEFVEGNNPESPVPVIPGHEFRIDQNHQWAMTIDLNSCTGCNACMISCQAENNIPIVGKNQVMAGREMHWVRMDRYFTSPKDYQTVGEQSTMGDYMSGKEEPGKRKTDDDNIEMITTPVSCLHCESAPCESVCPVNATVHTEDGLNAMAYNRCIGTRYCANNCPYKARRFNYYDYNKRPVQDVKMFGITAPGVEWGPLAKPDGNAMTTQRFLKNPNVTVRMRGVIEKCTYCVQRINKAKVA
ncbi:MAG: TAT-variant-translocated molybdopterin oxidoreductase, partial [Verrucomicrobiota bacterium]